MPNQENSSHFFKTWFWSKTIGRFVNKETGKEIRNCDHDILVPGPLYYGTVSEWYDMLIDMLFDASNNIQVENKIKPYSVVTFNRETKRTSYVECYSPVEIITVGTTAWDVLNKTKRFVKTTEFAGSLDGKINIRLDPMYPNSAIIVGEYGKNPILISVVGE